MQSWCALLLLIYSVFFPQKIFQRLLLLTIAGMHMSVQSVAHTTMKCPFCSSLGATRVGSCRADFAMTEVSQTCQGNGCYAFCKSPPHTWTFPTQCSNYKTLNTIFKKHRACTLFPSNYGNIMEVWENEKCCGNISQQVSISTAFLSSLNFHKCYTVPLKSKLTVPRTLSLETRSSIVWSIESRVSRIESRVSSCESRKLMSLSLDGSLEK